MHRDVLLSLTVCSLAAAVLLLTGCSPKQLPAFGAIDELTVVTNLDTRDEAVVLLESIFTGSLKTVGLDTMYVPVVVPASEFARYSGRYDASRNLVLLVDISKHDGLTKKVQSLLGTGVMSRIEQGPGEYFVCADVWALAQTLTIVAGAGEERIADLMRTKGYRLYAEVDSMVTEDTVEGIYERGERTSVTRDLAAKYGWSLRIPPGFRPAAADTIEGGMVFKLRADEPTRLVFVYWMPEANGLPDTKTCVELRARLASRIYDQDALTPTKIAARQVMFQGHQATRIEGAWRNDGLAAGGPFFSYCFVSGHRLYMIDVVLFAPNAHVGGVLRQLEALLLTFRG